MLSEVSSWTGAVYVGSAALLPMAAAHGAAGAILALANTEAEDCISAFAGDLDAHRRLAAAHLRMKSGSRRTLKEMAAERFGTSTTVRLP